MIELRQSNKNLGMAEYEMLQGIKEDWELLRGIDKGNIK